MRLLSAVQISAFASVVSLIPSAIAVTSLPTISAVGGKFFTENGDQFFIKGIAYQLSPDDPLVDGDQCARDVALMKTLGANAIRVYHVDAGADHSSCMSAFSDAGIYVLLDLDTFNTYILGPTLSEPRWNQTQYERYAAVMDAFASFDNVLGFYIGNEVIALSNQSLVAPYIKAATRDMKAYRDSKKYRDIPIGYATADIAELRPMLQDYLTCGDNPADTIDFFSLNSYEWCDPSTFHTSGYSNLQNMSENFPVPIFFSETGCNTPGPRLFEDQASIFGSDMDSDWSGALIYEWIQEENNYGLITYGSGSTSDVVRSGSPKPISPDFDNLKSQWSTLKPTGVARSAYNADSVSTRACPASTAGGWLVDGNVPLPTLGANLAAPTMTGASAGTGSDTDATTSGTETATGVAHMSSSSSSKSGVSWLSAVGAALAGVTMLFALL